MALPGHWGDPGCSQWLSEVTCSRCTYTSLRLGSAKPIYFARDPATALEVINPYVSGITHRFALFDKISVGAAVRLRDVLFPLSKLMR